jgi:hypothetical protein
MRVFSCALKVSPPISSNLQHAKPPLHQLKKSSSAGDFGGKTDLTIGDNTVEVTGEHAHLRFGARHARHPESFVVEVSK